MRSFIRGSARTPPVARPVWSRSHLVPVLFVYALSELHVALAHMCVRTYWDLWDHWDHP